MRLRIGVLALFVGLSHATGAQSPLPAQRGATLPGPPLVVPVDNWWNQDIRAAPVDPRSATFIAFINNGGTRRLHPDFGGYEFPGSQTIYGFPYAVVSAAQPKRAVQFYYADESDGVDDSGRSYPFYPIPDEAIGEPYWIEGGPPGSAASGGDRHMLIVDRDNRHLYELYDLRWSGTGWIAGSGAFFDLKTNGRRPDGWTSADAAGLAILPGLVRYDEVAGPDEIRHAFRVTVRATNGYVWPASHRAGNTPAALPMGARLRLKAGKNLDAYTPHVQKIFRAMQRYGLIVADNGSDMFVSGAFDPRWNNDVLNPAFRSLTAADFEVVELGWRGEATVCTAPSPPRALVVSASGLNARLAWQPPDAGASHTAYLLEVGSAPGVTDLARGTLPGSQLTLDASGGPGRYYVRVRAQNACGVGAASNELDVRLPACTSPGAAGPLQAGVSGRSVTLAWNVALHATDYVLEVGSWPGLSDLLSAPVRGAGLTTSAPPGRYFVRIRARNACGSGPVSDEIVVSVL